MTDGTCSIDGCEKRRRARGWCPMHYTRWQKHGDPLYLDPYVLRTPLDRFLQKVAADPSGCWLWQGSRKPDGYGQFSEKHRLIAAHRWSYRHFVGPIPAGFEIDHLCRNPPCVNPAHLEAVTPRVNNLRGIGPAARHGVATHCIHGHEFDEANTRIRPNGGRECLACRRLRNRGLLGIKAERRRTRRAAS